MGAGMRRTSTEPQWPVTLQGMVWGLADLVPSVASPHMDDGELGQNDGLMGGSGYLLTALDTQTNMSIVIPNGDKCLEPGPLASTGVILHRHNLQNLILEGCPQEKVNDLRFLDGQREEIDLQGLDLHVLDQAAQLGDGEPLLVAPCPQPCLRELCSLCPHQDPGPDAATKASAEDTGASDSRAPGPLGPPAALPSSTIWYFYSEEAIPHLLYPFICRWTFRLLPCLGYCK